MRSRKRIRRVPWPRESDRTFLIDQALRLAIGVPFLGIAAGIIVLIPSVLEHGADWAGPPLTVVAYAATMTACAYGLIVVSCGTYEARSRREGWSVARIGFVATVWIVLLITGVVSVIRIGQASGPDWAQILGAETSRVALTMPDERGETRPPRG